MGRRAAHLLTMGGFWDLMLRWLPVIGLAWLWAKRAAAVALIVLPLAVWWASR